MTLQQVSETRSNAVEKAEVRNDSEFRYWLVTGIWEIALQFAILVAEKERKE
jgi:hypothetical protein